jgi:fructokinase
MTREGRVVDVPGRTVEVVDTIGAGDSFMSGLLSGLADAGLARAGRIDAITPEALRDVLERAVRVAALTCARAGADPPTRAELDAAG